MPLSPWTTRGCRRTMRRISHMESLIFPFQGESKEKVLLYRIKNPSGLRFMHEQHGS